jgi:flagellar motor switch protein FliG
MGFVRAGFDWSRLLQPPDLYWIVSVVLGGIFFISASLYFIRNWRVSNVSVTEMPAAQAARAEISMPSPVGLTAAAEAEGSHSDDALPRPFAFVGMGTIPALAHVMRDWQAEDVALVTNYLAPELAARLMGGFHPLMQAEVAASLTIAREAGGQRVTALEDEVRSRLCFVVGGEDRVAAMLNFMDDEARDAYFDRMEATDAPAAERVKLRVRTFESIMRQASPEAVQALYRQSRPALLARVLLGVPGDVQRRVLDSLPPGASARMAEEMKFSRPLPPGRLKREKQALALLWSRMASTGEIEDEGPPLEAEQTGAGA